MKELILDLWEMFRDAPLNVKIASTILVGLAGFLLTGMLIATIVELGFMAVVVILLIITFLWSVFTVVAYNS